MLKCVLVDHDGETSRVIENVARTTGQMTIVKSCNTINEAMDIASTNEIDLIFLDLLIPGFKKSEFLERLRNDKSHLIALASKKEAVVDAYELDAADFILKPLTIDKLLSTLKKVLHSGSHELGRENSHLFVKVNSHLERVDLNRIFEIEAMSDYVNIYTKDKRYTIHSTMKGIESKLPANEFMRVHKSFIVRLDSITEIEHETLTVENKIIPVGTSFRRHLLDRLNII